jgi:pimeloyl-ACP methyl ester carboxylesterase
MGKFITANGLKVYYQDTGKGHPLILLHGATDTHKLWDPHLNVLTKHYRVLTPDTRGHGRSFNPSREMSYWLLGDDLAGFIQALELDKPYVFGYSDGGQAALELGMRYPDLVGALAIGGAWYRFSEDYQRGITEAGFVYPGKLDFEIYLKSAPPDWEDRLKLAHLDPDPVYPQILLESLARMWWTPLNYTKKDFSKIKVPTLIMMAEKDEFIPLFEGEEMAGMIPDAELVVIPGVNHSDLLLLGGVFLDHLLDFFKEVNM